MNGPFHEIPAGAKVPDEINAVIETPRGSRVRYSFESEIRAFRLETSVSGDEGYPADYGFVPSTISQDGYPLDIFVLCREPTFPGCVVECRPVGVLHLTDGHLPDSKILAVPIVDRRLADIRDLDDVPQETRDGIHRFFEEHRLLSGRDQDVTGWAGVAEAKDVVFKAWEGFLL